MRRDILLAFLVFGLSVTPSLEGRGRGYFGSSASALSLPCGPGAFGAGHVPGAIRHGHPNRGFSGFGFGRPNRGPHPYRPFYGPGMIYLGNSLSFQSQDYIVVPEVETKDSPALYYQKAPKSGAKPDCRDPWSQRSGTSSLSNFMNQLFELQCQNSADDGSTSSPQNDLPAHDLPSPVTP
ncbi:MAG: hypothetical protein AB1898_14990 [Acidobacteriota bacterium]